MELISLPTFQQKTFFLIVFTDDWDAGTHVTRNPSPTGSLGPQTMHAAKNMHSMYTHFDFDHPNKFWKSRH